MDFSEVVGSFGRWQLRVFLFFAFFNVVGMWQNFSIVFLAANVPFRCVQPPSPHNSTSSSFGDQCEVAAGNNSSTPCTQWEYDILQTSQTIVSEWDLVCDREWLVSLAKSSYMLGFLLSVVVFGQISDCIGRYPTILMCYVITCVSMLLSLLSNSFVMFAVLRFFHAFGRAGASTVGYVLIMEMVGPAHQAEVGIAVQLGWSVGFVTLVAVAWSFRHWFWLQLVISISFLPFALFFGIIPESPRWLLTQGKLAKLERLLRRASAINKREAKEDSRMPKKKDEMKKTATLLEVLKMPTMRIRTVYMIYIWFVNAFMYYALSYNTNDLAGSPYLNFFVAGFIEFPSYALVFWGIKKWGRRSTLLSCMMAGAVSSAALLFVPSNLPWLINTFAMVGKFCFTGSFGLLYLYTTEVFPTGVRNATLGSCSMCAHVGSILAPFLRDLGKATHSIVPNMLCTVFALTSGALTLLLPETRGLDLPDTLQEGEDLGKS
ncbi:organic cation transporter protein-like isoform X1 [Argiope bruennichi]|uniref:organic cation transporter protein-like isoform X1 n=1 Tax=Argiope bruennichi TaxID=94029 RepID=UPI002494D2B5|nr:organic cation transporter protein-like isoform X1 [Argiope bruennichi]